MNDAEPQPRRARPSCPKHIQAEERKEWRRIVRELESMRILSRADRSSMEAYCTQYGLWRQAKQQLNEQGGAKLYYTENGYPIQDPWLTQLNKAHDQMAKFWTEYGLTPGSRTRIRVEKQKPANPAEEYRRKKRMPKNKRHDEQKAEETMH